MPRETFRFERDADAGTLAMDTMEKLKKLGLKVEEGASDEDVIVFTVEVDGPACRHCGDPATHAATERGDPPSCELCLGFRDGPNPVSLSGASVFASGVPRPHTCAYCGKPTAQPGYEFEGSKWPACCARAACLYKWSPLES